MGCQVIIPYITVPATPMFWPVEKRWVRFC